MLYPELEQSYKSHGILLTQPTAKTFSTVANTIWTSPSTEASFTNYRKCLAYLNKQRLLRCLKGRWIGRTFARR
jgi:hypothetical protein